MTYPIKSHIPTRHSRFNVAEDLALLQPGQSFFVPNLRRGYSMAARASARNGFRVFAMRDYEGDVGGTTFWREEVAAS